MHTIIVIAIGFAVLAISAPHGRLRVLRGDGHGGVGFLPIWLIGASINPWIQQSGLFDQGRSADFPHRPRGASRRGAHPVAET